MEYTLLCLAALLLTSGLLIEQTDASTTAATTSATTYITTQATTTLPTTTITTTTLETTTLPTTTITTTAETTTLPTTTLPTTTFTTTAETTTLPTTTLPTTTFTTTAETTTLPTTTFTTTTVTSIPEDYCQNSCTLDEVCVNRNGIYGCGCSEFNERLNPENFGAIETCYGETGSLSLSRCQLFEAGYFAEMLHLIDPVCRGVMEGNQIVFHYDSGLNLCGTLTEVNATHFLYKNSVGTNDAPLGVISRTGGLNINFTCVYPLVQSISMPMAIQAVGGALSKEISTAGTYHITMLPFFDPDLSLPYLGNVTLQVNQQIYISVKVEEFNSHQIATVLDNCWATPVDDINSNIRWNLITNECPNPDDTTVHVLQNGVTKISAFSFKIFTFTSYPGNIYLHCQVHLCLKDRGSCEVPCGGARRRRRRRSMMDSAAISMKFTS